MQANEWGALLTLAAATSFTPGPNTTLSAALGAHGGWRHARHLVCAVPLGWALLLLLSTLGLGTLVMALPWLRNGIRITGILYLGWLAWRLAGATGHTSRPLAHHGLHWTEGVGLQFLNIKAWMLSLTIVSGWIMDRPDTWQRFWMVLPVLMVFAFASNLSYAMLGASVRRWLMARETDGPHTGRRLQHFNRVMALALLMTALWLWTTTAHPSPG